MKRLAKTAAVVAASWVLARIADVLLGPVDGEPLEGVTERGGGWAAPAAAEPGVLVYWCMHPGCGRTDDHVHSRR